MPRNKIRRAMAGSGDDGSLSAWPGWWIVRKWASLMELPQQQGGGCIRKRNGGRGRWWHLKWSPRSFRFC